jgi:hypothetical protein
MEKLEFCRQQLSAGTGSGSFFSQLKERHVVRVAIAYCVTAWLLAQIATQISPFFEIPNWSVRLVILVLVIGFPIALALAWAFEITPEGIVWTEEGMPNESSRRRTRYIFTVGITIVTLAAIGLFASVFPVKTIFSAYQRIRGGCFIREIDRSAAIRKREQRTEHRVFVGRNF